MIMSTIMNENSVVEIFEEEDDALTTAKEPNVNSTRKPPSLSAEDKILLKLNCVATKVKPFSEQNTKIHLTEDDNESITKDIENIDSLTTPTTTTDSSENGGQVGSHMLELYNQSLLIEENDDTQMDIDDDNNIQINLTENTKILELSRISWATTQNQQKYTKGVLWSPDGSCILSAVNLDGMHVIELPKSIHQNDNISDKRPIDTLKTAVHVTESGTVYDYAWYPYMNSYSPETCCWLASRQHEPIHLWDAFTGELRCTYRGYDTVDEIETAIAVTFSLDGKYVIGGYKKTIKIFQTSIPGREYTELNTKTPMSAFTMHSAYPDILIGGSWNSIIALYDLRATNLGALAKLRGHTGGITYLKSDQNVTFFSGARKDNQICQWDVRNYDKPIMSFQRDVCNNQRIYFDLNHNKQLATGGTDGNLRIWNIDNNLKELTYPLHHDSCNGVSFNQILPILATSAGHYHFIDGQNDKIKHKNSNHNDEEIYENSIIFWWYGDDKSE